MARMTERQQLAIAMRESMAAAPVAVAGPLSPKALSARASSPEGTAPLAAGDQWTVELALAGDAGGRVDWLLAKLGKLAKFCKFLAGSFSAVSKRNFARKYAFDSIFQALQNLHTSAPLQSQKFRKKSV